MPGLEVDIMKASPMLIEVEEFYPLVEAQSVTVLDTRSPEAYQSGHIPGALNVHDIFTYLATSENDGLEGVVRHFSDILSKAGVLPKDRVVIYEDALDSGYGQSCRGAFLLRYLGQQQVAVLHGGYTEWVKAGYPVSTETPKRIPLVYQATPDQTLTVTSQQMLESLQDDTIVKLDCRDWEEWAGLSSSPYGVDFAPRKGRIPGAVWLEWRKLIDTSGNVPRFRSPEEVRELCKSIGITTDTTVYVYCFKGSRSSNTMLALQNAGIKNVRNYFGSWNEWSRDSKLPINDLVLTQ